MAVRPGFALPVAVLLGLSACGGGAAPASSPAASVPAASGRATPVASSAPAKPAGSASASTSAAARGPIKIGVLESLTGTLAELGKEGQAGLTLALSEAGNSVAGRTIELNFADSQGQPDVALTKAKQLVESTKVQALMGIESTAECYAVAPYAKQAHIPLLVSGDCGAQGLTTDPKYKSPYLTRYSQVTDFQADAAALGASKAGYHSAIVMTADYAAGIEYSDFFSSAFISYGGSIVQELHPPLVTTDYGPYLTQLSPNADVLAVFMPGAGSLRFGQQYAEYAAKNTKLTVLDMSGQITTGSPGAQLGAKTAGFVAQNIYTTAYSGPDNQAFIKAFEAKNPGTAVSKEAANGYSGGKALIAALKKVNGNIEDTQPFLNALYATDISTPKGPLKLDSYHDVTENSYFYQMEPSSNGAAPKLLQTFTGVSQFWDRTPEQLARFKYGKMKGQWVGMTKAKLGDVITPPKSNG